MHGLPDGAAESVSPIQNLKQFSRAGLAVLRDVNSHVIIPHLLTHGIRINY